MQRPISTGFNFVRSSRERPIARGLIAAAGINLPLAGRMPALALNIRNLLHRFTLHAAIFLVRVARTIRMRALFCSIRHSVPLFPSNISHACATSAQLIQQRFWLSLALHQTAKSSRD